MFMIKRLLPILLAVTLVFCIFNPTYAIEATDTDNIKNVINQYFDNYYKSFQTLNIVNSDNIVEDNDNTLLAKATQNYMVEGYKVGGLYLKDYKVTLDYKTISFSGDRAKVAVRMNLAHIYSTTPDVNSFLINDYNFDFNLENNQWKITGIDSTSIELSTFKERVNDKEKQGFSKRDAIMKTEEENIKGLQQAINFIDGSSTAIKSKQLENTVARGYYWYDNDLGVQYARRFAVSYPSTRFFYTTGNDCTNFVSQCVWAAYGGYVDGNDTQTRSNISNGVRMISGSWYAGLGGGSSNWENSLNFWTYTTSSKSYGPYGIGLNNNSPYYNLAPSTIGRGDVLQIKTGSAGSYDHSMFVTHTLEELPTQYSNISVSYHSQDAMDVNLWSIILAYGQNNCFLREIFFAQAQFNS